MTRGYLHLVRLLVLFLRFFNGCCIKTVDKILVGAGAVGTKRVLLFVTVLYQYVSGVCMFRALVEITAQGGTLQTYGTTAKGKNLSKKFSKVPP